MNVPGSAQYFYLYFLHKFKTEDPNTLGAEDARNLVRFTTSEELKDTWQAEQIALRYKLLKYDTCEDEAERIRIIDDLLENQLSGFQIDHQAPAGAPGEDQEAAESSVLEEKYPEMWRHPLKTMLNLINSSNKIS